MSRRAKTLGSRSLVARNQPTAGLIQDAASARDVVLRLAGIDLQEQASIVRRSVDTMRVALDAMSVTVPEMPDFYARIKAAHGLLSLVGAFPSRTTTTHGTPQVSINIELPDWAQPMLEARKLVGQNTSSGTASDTS